MRRFKSTAQPQRFLFVHGPIHNLFRVGRHHFKAIHHTSRAQRVNFHGLEDGDLCLLKGSHLGRSSGQNRLRVVNLTMPYGNRAGCCPPSPLSQALPLKILLPASRFWERSQRNEVWNYRSSMHTNPALAIDARSLGESPRWANLARISHHLTTEAHDRPASTSLRLLAVLNVLSSTPCARQAARASC